MTQKIIELTEQELDLVSGGCCMPPGHEDNPHASLSIGPENTPRGWSEGKGQGAEWKCDPPPA